MVTEGALTEDEVGMFTVSDDPIESCDLVMDVTR
jgi:hypothetical protein